MIPIPGLATVKLIGLAVLVAGAVSLYFYVQSLRSELRAEAEGRTKLESVVDAQKQVMDRVTASIELMREVNARVALEIASVRADNRDLEKKFTETSAGKRRDLDTLASKKPKLIETRINNGTREALRCNEIATGSPVLPEDRANKICPGLVK